MSHRLETNVSETSIVSETFVSDRQLEWLIARKDFLAFILNESFNSYIT
jgi:hypothetical protein